MDTPQVYIECLADYNNGRPIGRWVEVEDEEQFQGAIESLLGESQYHGEEWAIHDYNGFFGSFLGEYPRQEEVVKAAQLILEYGEIFGKLVDYYGTIEEAIDHLEEKYCGCYESFRHFAEEWAEQEGEPLSRIPEDLHQWFDYDAYMRFLEISVFDVFECEDGTHVFSMR